MKYCRNLLFYLLVVIILGSLLSPLLYWWADALDIFTDVPFKRVANRAFMLVGAVFFYPLMKSLRVKKLDSWGMAGSWHDARAAIYRGFLFGVVSMTVLVIVEYFSGIFILDSRYSGEQFYAFFWGRFLIRAVGTGLVVAFLEELFFRGAIFHLLRRDLSLNKAIVFSSLSYSFIHFIRSSDVVSQGEVTWYAGFRILGSAFHSFAKPETVGPFLALFVVGLFLVYLRIETGSIFASVGVHAAWVFCIQIGRKLFNVNPESNYNVWIRGYDQMTGYSSFVWVLILLCVMWAFFRYRKRKKA